MSLTGDPDGPAYRSGVSVFDVMSGLQSVIGVLAALRHRDATGQGQHVEVNLLSTALAAMANHSSTYVAAGSVPFRMGNAHPSLFPYEPLPCSDGELVVVAANDPQFRKLAAALGRPELADDPRFGATHERNRNREALRPLLLEVLATDTVEGWFERLTAAGVPCGPINTIDGGVALAERLGLDPVVQVGEGDDAVPMIRNALRFSETPAQYSTPAPALGRRLGRGPRLAAGRVPGRGARREGRLMPEFPTSIGTSDPTTIRLLGQDLAADLLGQVGFGELAFWLAARRRPSAGEVRLFEAVLVSLTDHGFTPTAIAARLTYYSAPDSVQGALAAGILGGGSRFLGVTEDTGRWLHRVLEGLERRRTATADRRGVGRGRPRGRPRRACGRREGPRHRSPRAQGGRPARPGDVRDRRGQRQPR